MAIAVVGKLVVGGRNLLKTLRCYTSEIAGEFSVLREYHRSPRYKAVDQILLPHLLARLNRNRERRASTQENLRARFNGGEERLRQTGNP